jgi:transposase-like protein
MSETVSKRKYAPELREKAFKLYCEEMTFATISERWDVPVKVLHRWSCDNKWKQRREELRAKQRATDAGPTSPDPALLDAPPENLSLLEAQVEYENYTKAAALRIARIIKRTPDAQLIASADKIEKLDKIARKALKLESEKPRMAINIRMLAEGKIRRLVNAGGVPASDAPSLLIDAGSNPATGTNDDTSED